jgi:hypothetical protein
LSADFGFDVSLKYEDRDGDYISLTSQNDLNDLFLYVEGSTVNVVVTEAISLPQLTQRKSSQSGLQPLLAPLSREWSRSSVQSSQGPSTAFPQRFPASTNSARPLDRFPNIDGRMTESNNIRWKRGEMLGQVRGITRTSFHSALLHGIIFRGLLEWSI